MTVILVDNTERESSSEFFKQVLDLHPYVRCLKTPTNLGYFGGANFGLTKYLKDTDYPDWVIVSNVDIEFNDKSFFRYLYDKYPNADDIGVIAPSIWTDFYRTDRNPHMLARLTPSQIRYYRTIYRFYPLTFFILL